CASTVSERHDSGIGSQEASVPKPNGGVGPSQGIGTRQPSRPRSVCPDRSQIGSASTSSGRSVTSGSPNSSPWYRYADPGNASISKAAALARRSPSSPPPYRVTWRTTSWLDSTQVVGAPTAAVAASEESITVRSATASHSVVRYSKLN